MPRENGDNLKREIVTPTPIEVGTIIADVGSVPFYIGKWEPFPFFRSRGMKVEIRIRLRSSDIGWLMKKDKVEREQRVAAHRAAACRAVRHR